MNVRRLALAALASVLFGPALGQAPGQLPSAQPPAAPAIPEYKVEIIVFGYRDVDPNEERLDHRAPAPADVLGAPLVPRPPPVFDDRTLEPLPGDPESSAEPLAPFGATPFRFRLLAPEELMLTRERAAIERIDAYDLIVHGGWVQQGLPEADARPFDLALLGVLNPRGGIRLHLSRFLHVRLDLSYEVDGAVPSPPRVFGDNVLGNDSLTEFPLTPRYTLRAERQTSSGELQYFDHPAFGVLVLVTPLPPDAVPVGVGPQPAA